MALLPNITYSPGEPMQSAFDKINALVDTFNSVVAGGLSDQILKKVSNSDFDTIWADIIKELPNPSGQTGKALGNDGSMAIWEFVSTILAGSLNIKFNVVDIGDWNMDTDNSKSVPHGVADWTKIIAVAAVIVNDANTLRYVFTQRGESGMETSGIQNFDATNINFFRTTSGVGGSTNFNSAAFSATSYNRGKILIVYQA